MQGIPTLIGKLEPFLGDAYQIQSWFENFKKLIKKKNLDILVQINFCSYVGITYNLPVIYKQVLFP